MRKRAPAMFGAGIVMTIVQIIAMYGIIMGMVAPPCISNIQCKDEGQYCETAMDGKSGRCQACGEQPMLIPYHATTKVPGTSAVSGFGEREYQEMNKIFDQSYPHLEAGIKRSDIPDQFGGYNFTMVKNRCTLPIQSFRWAATKDGDGETPDGSCGNPIIMRDRGDLPVEFKTSRAMTKHFSARTVKSWCAKCVRRPGPNDLRPEPLNENGLAVYDNVTGLEVSVMNSKLVSILAVNAMSQPDWMALFLCSYVAGLTVVGEIKDNALCTMSIERHIAAAGDPDTDASKLHMRWLIALEVLGILRMQFFLLPLMGAIPVVVLTQGGSAMSICFNTIAILFITEIDNMTYHLGLGEREKERVDTRGHVILTDDEAKRLSHTKALCTVTCVIGTLWLVSNGAVVAAFLSGFFTVLIFKLSELATHSSKTVAQKVIFVVKAFVMQIAAFGCFMS